ncbi:MAG: hypothetical protein GY711_06620 [bacterium]|nr:hypothetical protein [bacterium]
MRLTVLLVLAAPGAAQSALSPAVSFSVHDEPRDGVGDVFNAPPFEGLLREQSTREDRALQEFDVTAFGGASLANATLSGTVDVNNAFDNGVRTFDFLLYAGNGSADLADFQVAATSVGAGSYAPPADTSFDYSFDVTAAVQALLDGGASFVGLRVDPTSDPNFPNVLSASASVGREPGLDLQFHGRGLDHVPLMPLAGSTLCRAAAWWTRPLGRAFLWINGESGARVSGFTILNGVGKDAYQAGGAILADGGTIDDCRIAGCSALEGGGIRIGLHVGAPDTGSGSAPLVDMGAIEAQS